jgi:acetyl esterase/lipase
MKPYPVHKDFSKLHFTVPLYSPVLPILQRITRLHYRLQQLPEGIDYHETTIVGHDGYPVPLEICSPALGNFMTPCIFLIHGGAFVLPAAAHHKHLMADYAVGCSAHVILVDYRLAPQYPYPYGLEDCFSAYNWILEHADELHIDARKIAICGDSAGGALAAGLTHLIRDRQLPAPQFCMLIYPVLDARCNTNSMKQFPDTPIWNAKLNKKMWKLYASHVQKSPVSSYMSPNEASAFHGLPAGYIEVNEYDCLRDEAIEYYHKLKNQGIDIKLVQTKRTIHGFEMNYESVYTQQLINKRIEYMKTQFAAV